jgi:hypothetical protein
MEHTRRRRIGRFSGEGEGVQVSIPTVLISFDIHQGH